MRPSVSLKLERLEERSVPAVFGHPWASSNITLSFAPDGTDISGSASNLSSVLANLGDDSGRHEILRAFQDWVANANINIGVVGDNGDAFDAPGLVQGDQRFGDIRVGGRNWASDVLALTTPFNYFNTQSGNVALNTAASLNMGGGQGQHDLYTAVLQEAGHSLGVGNSDDLGSVMYEYYQGVRSGLAASDIASIQALYGARRNDTFEGETGNHSLETATSYTAPLTADITTATDVDVYAFVANGSTSVIKLHAAGLSLLQANVDVVDEFGDTIASAGANSPINNDVTLNVADLQVGSTYFVRVSGNTQNAFGIGSYSVSVDASETARPVTMAVLAAAGNSFDTASVLAQTVTTVDQQLDYTVQATPDQNASVSFFQIHAPTGNPTQAVHLIVSVMSPDAGQNLTVSVFDANHNPLAARVLTDVSGATVIQVDNVQSNVDYFIEVGATSTFNMTVDFTAKDVPFTLGSTGNAATTQSATLTVCQSQVLYFVLSADAGNGIGTCMTVTDASGNVICVLSSAAGTSRSASVFLASGSYRVRVSALTADPPLQMTSTSLTYSLAACTITDPIGAPIVNPTATPVGSTPPPVGSTPPPNVNGQTVYWIADNPGFGSIWF